MHEIHPIQVLEDNIIWVWSQGNKAVVVDPSVTEPVKNWLNEREMTIVAVLQTHHHEDHIGGTKGLLQYWPNADVIASKEDIERIPFQTVSVCHKEKFYLMGCQVTVIGVAGHTKTHVAYYLDPIDQEENIPALFCGDTLFGAGCGRLFEGTAEDMFLALKRLGSLPEKTKVYCAHEYTESNLHWATSIDPANLLIKNRLDDIKKKRKLGLLSLPTTILEEKSTNLFLGAKSIQELAELRRHKDNWRD